MCPLSHPRVEQPRAAQSRPEQCAQAQKVKASRKVGRLPFSEVILARCRKKGVVARPFPLDLRRLADGARAPMA